MYYVYVLKNESTQELYYGFTADVKRRLNEHNAKESWRLIYYEAYLSEADARRREMKLKNYGQSRKHLKNRIKESLSYKISAGSNSQTLEIVNEAATIYVTSFRKSSAH